MFDRLKRIFIVEDKNAKAARKAKRTDTPVVETIGKTSSKPSQKTTKSAMENGTPSQKFTEILFNAIETNDLEGFDYLEYQESLQSLAKMDMDEATRYKSAFAMAQTMGASPKQLIDSANHYKNVLVEEESKFGQALENQRSKQINEQEYRIEGLQKSIDTKKQQLAQIQEQITTDESALVEAQEGLSGAAAKINATKANFMASFQQISDQLDSDIEKMKTYLK